MKVIFMGTHQFAVKVLEKILERHEVVLVVTQPDSLVGRKKILTPSFILLYIFILLFFTINMFSG